MSKWLWIAIGVVAVGGMVWASLLTDSPGWEEAQRWCAERRIQWRQDGCPVVGGWPADGCSRADYAMASKLSEALPDRFVNGLTALEEGDGVLDPQELTLVAPIVAALRQGAGRISDVDDDQERFGPEVESSMVDCIAIRNGLVALQLTARSVAKTDGHAAAAVLLDGVAAAMDLATAGIAIERLVGMAVVEGLVNEFDDAMLRRLDVEALQKLGRALDDIIAVQPPSDDFLERSIAYQVAFAQSDRELDAFELGVHRWQLWRSGFSLRTFAIGQVCHELDLLKRTRARADPASASWPERKRALAWLETELDKQPVSHFGRPGYADLEIGLRRSAVTLQLLRQAVAFHCGEPVPEFPDLLGGGTLRCTVDGDTATFVSEAKDLSRTARRDPR